MNGKPIGNKQNNNLILASEQLNIHFIIDSQEVCLKLIFVHVEVALEYYRYITHIIKHIEH